MRDLGIANRALMALRPFFFHEPATTEIYTLSLHDALPILFLRGAARGMPAGAAPETNLLGKFGALLGILDRKSTRLNSSHTVISYAVFCLKKKTIAPPMRHLPAHATAIARTTSATALTETA